jgi:hypothetical protein
MMNADQVLNRLAPADGWVPDWPDVLQRAGQRRSARLVTKRRLVVLFAVLAAVLAPLAALGAADDWWFLSGGAPTPTKAPVVVQEGEWDGHPWQLIAYPSTTDGLCVSVSPKGSTGDRQGGAMGCGTFAGVARTPETKASPNMTITYLSGAASTQLPAYIAGPVIGKATTVEIRFANGDVVRVPTFLGPEPLAHVRFYATQLPSGVESRLRPSAMFLKWVAGFDANGNMVACLAPPTARNGVSSLSDCREH